MVRSILEYCCPLWSPLKIMDIPELESVQKVFTSKISGMSELNYWQRLQKLSLMSLQKRRERYIILHTWKILNKKTSNDLHVQFSLSFVPALEIRQKSLPSRRTRQHFTGLHMNVNLIRDMDFFKKQFNEFSLSVPDAPPVRGYTCAYSNSLSCWRKDKEASASWSGQKTALLKINETQHR